MDALSYFLFHRKQTPPSSFSLHTYELCWIPLPFLPLWIVLKIPLPLKNHFLLFFFSLKVVSFSTELETDIFHGIIWKSENSEHQPGSVVQWWRCQAAELSISLIKVCRPRGIDYCPHPHLNLLTKKKWSRLPCWNQCVWCYCSMERRSAPWHRSFRNKVGANLSFSLSVPKALFHLLASQRYLLNRWINRWAVGNFVLKIQPTPS